VFVCSYVVSKWSGKLPRSIGDHVLIFITTRAGCMYSIDHCLSMKVSSKCCYWYPICSLGNAMPVAHVAVSHCWLISVYMSCNDVTAVHL